MNVVIRFAYCYNKINVKCEQLYTCIFLFLRHSLVKKLKLYIVFHNTVEPLLYDHSQNHIGVVV